VAGVRSPHPRPVPGAVMNRFGAINDMHPGAWRLEGRRREKLTVRWRGRKRGRRMIPTGWGIGFWKHKAARKMGWGKPQLYTSQNTVNS